MIAMPAPRHEPSTPDRPFTIAEYARLAETRSGYTELIEGALLMSPSPTPKHNIASGRLYVQLSQQIPTLLEVIQDVDIDLQLAPPTEPGFSRRPDLIVVNRGELKRVEAQGGLLRASEVLVVIEIVSRGSRRTDWVYKRAEYEEARIPWYWILDIEGRASLDACELTEGGGYRERPRVTGTFRTEEPFPVTVELDQLV